MGADTITETSAIVRGTVSASGTKLVECGMYLGYSPNDMTFLGSDSINTYGTPCFYSTAKYGRTLTPGTTYYYKVYAKASNGTIAWGDAKSFTTIGTTKVTPQISLSDTSFSLPEGTCTTLTATTTPAGQAVTWSSSNKSVATVNSSGMVDCKSFGTTTITAKMVYEGSTYTATCTVTVTCGDHSYSGGICKDCGYEWPYDVKTVSSAKYKVTNSDGAPVWSRPYSNNSNKVDTLSAGSIVTVVGQTTNQAGNKWYKLSDGNWIYSGNVEKYKEVQKEEPTQEEPPIIVEDPPMFDLTAKWPSHIGTTTARVDAYCAYTGTRPSSVGLYFGTSESSLSYFGSDEINHNKNPFDIWYDLSGLTPNTTYYYQFYAVVDGVTKPGVVHWFTTEPETIVDTLDLTAKSPSHVGTTTARVDAYCAYTGTRPSSVGLYIGTSESSLSFYKSDVVDFTKNPFDIWYDLSGLTPNTTYYYQFYAVVNGETKPGLVHWFTTQPAPVDTLDLTAKSPSHVGTTTARVDAYCAYTGTRPSSVGLYIGTSESSLSYFGSDEINHSKNPFDIWYNLSGLAPNTTYYYQFYAVVDGVTKPGLVHWFTTQAAPTNLRTGVVVNTNGAHLAINNAPAASPTYSTQIGRIPPGAAIEVDLDRTSGNWYWVKYYDVSGYAYAKFIELR